MKEKRKKGNQSPRRVSGSGDGKKKGGGGGER
jgi:hypothetical protein